MYKFDTHAHTRESSICADISASDLVDLYIKAGYSGVCITDHYDRRTFLPRSCKSWERYIDCFLKGYRKALEYGNQFNFTVLLGAEIKLCDSDNDFLLHGITEQFLYDNPSLYDYDIGGFHKLMKRNGILVFQAHPFRDEITREGPRYLDGVEVFNANPRHNSYNVFAYDFAFENNLLMLAGSDTHRTEDVGRSGIITENRITNLDLLKEVLTKKQFKIIEI